MEKSRDYVEAEISFKGKNRKIQIAAEGYEEAKLPEHPATPLYTVVFPDQEMSTLIGADRIQVPLSNPPYSYEQNPLLQDASGEQRDLVKEIYKAVRKHHDVFNPESI